MKTIFSFHTGSRLLAALFLFVAAPSRGAEAHLEVLEFESRTLKGNPLHDPSVRRVAVFVPVQYTNGVALPVVYYLPGYDNASDKFISEATNWIRFTQKVADEVTRFCSSSWTGAIGGAAASI